MAGRVLLLQGPVGSFFSRVATELKAEGNAVFKINFNGGDEACYGQSGAERYTGDLSGWPRFLTAFVRRHAIDRILLFGDCRPYHRAAIRVFRELDIAFFVFEEGYVRPDYITLEPGGVNGHSALSRNPADYPESDVAKPDAPLAAGSGFWPVAWHTVRYYLAAWKRRKCFPYYVHHRPLNPFREGLCWLRSGLKKLYYRKADRPLVRYLAARPNSYYLAPLQVHCDAQMTHHSGGLTVEGFIARVIRSFAEYAPAETELVLKHHPMDRAYYHHGSLIEVLAAQYGVHGRVHYLNDGHLPTLLRNARGTVTVNSTVGLSSALHRTPIKVVGNAVYDMPGLTCQEPLDRFWRAPGEVDHRLYRRYREHLVRNVLANGSFYRRVRADDRGATGIKWPFGSLTAVIDPLRVGKLPAAEQNGSGAIVADTHRAVPALSFAVTRSAVHARAVRRSVARAAKAHASES